MGDGNCLRMAANAELAEDVLDAGPGLRGLMKSCAAICRYLRPSARSWRISSSRLVSRSAATEGASGRTRRSTSRRTRTSSTPARYADAQRRRTTAEYAAAFSAVRSSPWPQTELQVQWFLFPRRGTAYLLDRASETRAAGAELPFRIREERLERREQVTRNGGAVRVAGRRTPQTRSRPSPPSPSDGERLNGLNVDAEPDRLEVVRRPEAHRLADPVADSPGDRRRDQLSGASSRGRSAPRWRALRSARGRAPGRFPPASRTTGAPSRAEPERDSRRRRNPIVG